MSHLLLLVLLGAVSEDPRPIVIGERVALHSEVLGEERTIQVHLPSNYAWSETPYPVVYLLDGESNFHHTTATLDTLSRLGHTPDVIVVAINNTDRTRDLTPRRIAPVPDGEEDRFPTSGGADTFVDFFERELFPYVERSYRTAPYRILIGHSFGGLFAVHAFVHRGELFDAYLAISPSLWWDENRLVEDARALFESRPALAKRLFVSLADEVEIMRPPYKAFVELLRYQAPAGLAWQAREMGDDDHGTTPLGSTHYGMRALFPLWRPPSSEADGGIEALDRHFARLSEAYGYTIATPERSINALGRRLLREDELEKARAVFEANVARYPRSPNVYDSLGEVLEALGERDAAIQSFERAVALAEELDHPRLDTFRRHLEEMEP